MFASFFLITHHLLWHLKFDGHSISSLLSIRIILQFTSFNWISKNSNFHSMIILSFTLINHLTFCFNYFFLIFSSSASNHLPCFNWKCMTNFNIFFTFLSSCPFLMLSVYVSLNLLFPFSSSYTKNSSTCFRSFPSVLFTPPKYKFQVWFWFLWSRGETRDDEDSIKSSQPW